MQGGEELVAVFFFGQAIDIGAVFDTVVNQAETMWHYNMTPTRCIRNFQFYFLVASLYSILTLFGR